MIFGILEVVVDMKSRESLYRSKYWCSNCGSWFDKDQAAYSCSGRPLCPGCHTPARTNPRDNKYPGMVRV